MAAHQAVTSSAAARGGARERKLQSAVRGRDARESEKRRAAAAERERERERSSEPDSRRSSNCDRVGIARASDVNTVSLFRLFIYIFSFFFSFSS